MKSLFNKIAIGSDHAGVALKKTMIDWLMAEGLEVIDKGPETEERVDYPDYAYAVARDVSDGIADAGIVICGTGIGVSITANKVKNIRAALCHCTDYAELARAHNNANIVALGARFVADELAKEIVKTFLTTPFAGNRHEKRVSKIHNLTSC